MWVVDALESYVERVKPKPERVVWVTELATCLRFSYYTRVSRIEIPFASIVSMEMGRAVHELVKRVLGGDSRVLAMEVPVSRLEYVCGRWVLVRGRADLLVVDDDGDPVVVEVKTGEEVKPWHRIQAMIYAHLLGAPRAYILLIKRSSGKVEYASVPGGLAAARLYDERLKTLVCAMKREKEPPPEPKLGFCQWCPLDCPARQANET